jgi:hypothetical protein
MNIALPSRYWIELTFYNFEVRPYLGPPNHALQPNWPSALSLRMYALWGYDVYWEPDPA